MDPIYQNCSRPEERRRKRAAVICTRVTDRLQRLFGLAALRRISENFDLYPEFLTLEDLEQERVDVSEIEVLFGSWGFPILSAAQLHMFTRLQHVFFGAGSIKRFGLPILQAGIPICSSKRTNARVVADFCLAQILLATKRYFQNISSYHCWEQGIGLKDKLYRFRGYNGSSIALIGCGWVSRFLIEHLRARNFRVYVVDPYLSKEESVQLGVEKTTLEAAFAQSDVVSNHLPDLPELQGIIRKEHFESMLDGATFLNTGRGPQVDENALVCVFEQRPDLIALLDVSISEPPVEGSRLYDLPNVHLSSHIAGCVGGEVDLLIGEAITSAEKWLRGELLDNLESFENFSLIA